MSEVIQTVEKLKVEILLVRKDRDKAMITMLEKMNEVIQYIEKVKVSRDVEIENLLLKVSMLRKELKDLKEKCNAKCE